MTDPYQVLGITPSATDEEVKAAYRKMVRKYHPDNFAGNDTTREMANEKMQQINEAYDRIQLEREKGGSAYTGAGTGGGAYNDRSFNPVYNAIRKQINSGRFADADAALEKIPVLDRNAEWHFLKSIVLMRRGWANDAMRELEIACGMDPANQEYQQAKQMFNNQANGYGSTYYGDGGRRPVGGGCSMCDLCVGMMCADMCCDCAAGCG